MRMSKNFIFTFLMNLFKLINLNEQNKLTYKINRITKISSCAARIDDDNSIINLGKIFFVSFRFNDFVFIFIFYQHL